MSATPRVVMVVRQFYPWVGGAEQQAQKLSAVLIRHGVDVRVVTGWWQWGTPRQDVIDNIPVFRNFAAWNMFGVRGLRKFAAYLYLVTLIWHLWRTHRTYDVVHVQILSYPAWAAVLASRWLGKKVIITLQNSGPRSDILRMRKSDMLPGQRQMLPLTLQADRLVGLSRQIVAELEAAGVPAARIDQIPTGVEIQPASARTYRLDGHVTVIFVGRLHPIKGLPTLLRAFQQVIAARPALTWRLWLLGDGPLRSQLEAQAAALGITSATTFWGKVDDVQTYLSQADLFVLPSLTEGMSNALLEAMALGLPCIASRVGSNPDLIHDRETGLLISPENEPELVAALQSLADDEALRRRVGLQARELAEREYGLDRVAQRYIALYHSLAQLPDATPEAVTC